MAIEILTRYTPELIAAFSLCGYGIHAISDLCLPGGLIAEDEYRSVIDSESDIKKCETLLSALQRCVKQDETCFESVLSVLQKVLGSQNQWVLVIEDEYYKDSTPPSKRRKTGESPTEQEYFADPEIKAIQTFTPELIRAVDSCSISVVSNEFLAKELITDGMCRRILDPSILGDNKIRILLNAVKDAIRTDSSCFKMAMDILKAFPLCSEVILAIESKYKEFTSQGSPNGNCGTTGNDQARPRHLTVSPEISVLQVFTPKLRSAIMTCLQELADQCCYKNGLIYESKCNQLVEVANVYSEDNARILLQAIEDTITTDKRCFEIFLDALSTEMPHAISRSLISSIKNEYEHHKLIPMLSPAPVTQQSEMSISKQDVLDRLEKAVKESVRANIEKERLEEELALKVKENDELKEKLKAAEIAKGTISEKVAEIRRLNEKLKKCQSEIDELNDKISEQNKIIEEYDMIVRREETVAQGEYKKMVDDLRAAKEAKTEMKEKIQLQKSKMDELEVKLRQEKETHERKISELQASIDELNRRRCSCFLCRIHNKHNM